MHPDLLLVSGVLEKKLTEELTHSCSMDLVVPYEAQPNKVREYYRNGSQWTNTLSIASGGEKGGFNLSLSNMDTEAILPGSSYDRRTINLRI